MFQLEDLKAQPAKASEEVELLTAKMESMEKRKPDLEAKVKDGTVKLKDETAVKFQI